MNRIMAPFVAPTKVRSLQGKRPAGSGGRALWGPEWTHPPAQAPKYCHNGGMTFADCSAAEHHASAAPAGSIMPLICPPPLPPQKCPICRQIRLGTAIRALGGSDPLLSMALAARAPAGKRARAGLGRIATCGPSRDCVWVTLSSLLRSPSLHFLGHRGDR